MRFPDSSSPREIFHQPQGRILFAAQGSSAPAFVFMSAKAAKDIAGKTK
jgi:hypothetical protein